MKKLPDLFLCLFFLASFSHAQLKDLTINADKISLEKEKYRLEAEGSVEAAYKDVLLHGNHLIYNTSAESFFADRGFKLFFQGMTIEGETLDYEIKEQRGTAAHFAFLYQGVSLGGERLGFDREKYELKNASFTTCDILEKPHYHVTAANLLFYPKYGWMVAYWGFFWLGNFPIVPMPTYIYDFQAEEKAQKNLPPFPEIGANDDDGSYISEKLAWHLRRELSGTYSLGYAANKGLLTGINANYIIDDRNNGEVRLNWNPKDRTFGGLTHHFSFGGEMVSPEKPLFEFFAPTRWRQFELETTLSSRERINYQRVSFLPNLCLRSRRGEIARKEAKYDMELLAGLIAEEGNTKLVRGGGNLKIFGDFQETAFGYITPSLKLEALFYSNGTKWVKPSVELDLSKDFRDDLSLGLGYMHYLLVEGQSPFNFEMYRFRAVDRLKGELRFKLGETAAKVAASYFLDNWSPEDIDYTLFFKLHCYNLEVTYRSMRREFQLGFSLASQ